MTDLLQIVAAEAEIDVAQEQLADCIELVHGRGDDLFDLADRLATVGATITSDDVQLLSDSVAIAIWTLMLHAAVMVRELPDGRPDPEAN